MEEIIKVYKVIDDNTAPGSIVYEDEDEVLEHLKYYIEDLPVGQSVEIKVIAEEMNRSEFENLPEFEG